jgi:hypothetical protein
VPVPMPLAIVNQADYADSPTLRYDHGQQGLSAMESVYGDHNADALRNLHPIDKSDNESEMSNLDSLDGIASESEWDSEDDLSTIDGPTAYDSPSVGRFRLDAESSCSFKFESSSGSPLKGLKYHIKNCSSLVTQSVVLNRTILDSDNLEAPSQECERCKQTFMLSMTLEIHVMAKHGSKNHLCHHEGCHESRSKLPFSAWQLSLHRIASRHEEKSPCQSLRAPTELKYTIALLAG